MKKNVVLSIILLLNIFVVHGQRLDTLSSDAKQQYQRYLQKRSTNLTVGWVLLGTGMTLASAWYLSNTTNGWNGSTKGEGMLEVGVATALLSTPFFIMAGANKRKASLALKAERRTSVILSSKTFSPAFAIRWNL